MNRQVVVLIMMIVLVALVGAQAIQISDLKDEIADGALSVSGATGSSLSPTGGSQQQATPTMVGGC
ncbi:MAG: hypothetical protein ABIB47_00040 [Candidatus Woesearchaeota archaeon]